MYYLYNYKRCFHFVVWQSCSQNSRLCPPTLSTQESVHPSTYPSFIDMKDFNQGEEISSGTFSGLLYNSLSTNLHWSSFWIRNFEPMAFPLWEWPVLLWFCYHSNLECNRNSRKKHSFPCPVIKVMFLRASQWIMTKSNKVIGLNSGGLLDLSQNFLANMDCSQRPEAWVSHAVILSKSWQYSVSCSLPNKCFISSRSHAQEVTTRWCDLEITSSVSWMLCRSLALLCDFYHFYVGL